MCIKWLKRWKKNFSLWGRFFLDALQVGGQIFRSRSNLESTPIFLCMANPGSIGGTELQLQILSEALKERFGCGVILISGDIEGQSSNRFLAHLASSGIFVLHLRSLGVFPYDEWPLFDVITRKLFQIGINTPKIFHFFNPASTALAPIVKQMGSVICYMETGMPASQGSCWHILHRTASHFDFVTSVSAAGLRAFELLFGYAGKGAVIPSLFKKRHNLIRSKIPEEGVFNLVYFGRMTRGKGIDLLIEAFAQVRQELPYARLFLIGSGERVSLLENLISARSLSGSVHFSPWLEDEELSSLLARMDLFCLPSFSEGVPCSILEVMSIGLPVVATRVGGVGEIIEENVSGILIQPHDLEELTEALLALARDPLRRAELGKQALLRAKKIGSQRAILNRMMNVYSGFLIDRLEKFRRLKRRI